MRSRSPGEIAFTCSTPPCNTPTRIMARSWAPKNYASASGEGSSVRASRVERTYVVRRIAVLVHAPAEGGRGILAPLGVDERLTAGVLVRELLDVVDEAGDDHEEALLRFALDCWSPHPRSHAASGSTHVSRSGRWKRTWKGRGLTALPADDGEVLDLLGPADGLLGALEALELHGEDALADLVLGEDVEVGGEAEGGARGDEPLCGVELVPADRVAVVHGELVVEIVVPFAHREQGCGARGAGALVMVRVCDVGNVAEYERHAPRSR